MSDPDHVRLLQAVARHFFGDPNRRLSKKGELRFGTHGSLSIDLQKGVWFDHEANEGGGPLDLIKRETSISEPREAYAWAEREGYWINGRARDSSTMLKHGGQKKPRREPAATYDYTDEGGELLSQVVRYDPKGFRQRRPDGDGGWIWNIEGVRRVPYRLPELLEALDHTVFIVEGEKDVDNLRRLDAPATCNLGGAGNWNAELNQYFAKANVVIIADNDPQAKHKKTDAPLFHADGRPRFPGWDHAVEVAQHLREVADSVRLIDLKKVWPQCPDKGDISNWIEAGGTIEALYKIAEEVPIWDGNVVREVPKSEPPPLPYVDLSLDLVPRDWLVPERIPMRNVSLLSGEGAMGKSLLLMQLSGAVVLGRDWLSTLPTMGPVLYVSCEEDDDEIRRRIEAVAIHYGSSRLEMIERGLRVLSFAGEDAILGLPDRNDIIKPTPLFERIQRDALQLRPKLIALDASADVFGGKENDRAQTRQFITLQRGLAIKVDAAVVMVAHPSLTGIATDTGLSGNTAWHNSVRARMYFKTAPGDDASLRVLEVKKNNYGPQSENILLRWKNGVYVVEPGKGTLARMAAEQEIDHLFLTLLRRLADQGRNVSDKVSPSYAPSVFANEPDALAAKATKKTFAEAMTRLFAARKIRVVPFGPASKMRSKIVEAVAGDEETGTATILPFPGAASNVPSNGLPTASNGLPTGCAPTPPIPPSPVGRGQGSLEATAPSQRGKAAIKVSVIGECPDGTPCLHCNETGDVKRVVNAAEAGGKSETLHLDCAPAWFAKE